MDLLTLLPVLLIAVLALLVVVYLSWSILGPIFELNLGSAERRRLRIKQNQLLKVDEALNAQNYELALQLLNQSFCFDTISHDAGLIRIISGHNLSLLGKLLVIADAKARQLDNVGVVEELLNSRGALLQTLLEVKQSYVSARVERRSKGAGALPKWARDEYDRKIADIVGRLETNKQSLLSELHTCNNILSSSRSSNQVTYH